MSLCTRNEIFFLCVIDCFRSSSYHYLLILKTPPLPNTRKWLRLQGITSTRYRSTLKNKFMKYLKGHLECLEKTIVLCFLKCCSFSLQKCLEELWDLFYNDNVQFWGREVHSFTPFNFCFHVSIFPYFLSDFIALFSSHRNIFITIWKWFMWGVDEWELNMSSFLFFFQVFTKRW